MRTTPRKLAEVLAPVGTAEFLQDILGKRYQYVPGHAGKFAAFLTWAHLNHILTSHQLDAPRLRLAREGKILPPESFIA